MHTTLCLPPLFAGTSHLPGTRWMRTGRPSNACAKELQFSNGFGSVAVFPTFRAGFWTEHFLLLLTALGLLLSFDYVDNAYTV